MQQGDVLMYYAIPFRSGTFDSIVAEFFEADNLWFPKYDTTSLEMPDNLIEENILAVHFADRGAQGEAGAVNILYYSPKEVKIFYGNYVWGKLDLDAVIRKLPMLKYLDSRHGAVYPFGGGLHVPEEWGYMYMGAMNHFFVRNDICDNLDSFISYFLENGGQKGQIFDVVAWFFGVKLNSLCCDG